jgi:three-Cys-motif partner protein
VATRIRRPREATFFDELKQWSEIKLRILEKYLDTYRKYRGRFHPTIWYVDGFAGTGYYGEDESSGEGSPVRLAKLAQGIAAAGKPYRLKCFNVELDRDNHEKLCRSLAPFPVELVQIRHGAFADHLPEILRITHGCPAVFFLDAFGPKPVTVDAVRPVVQRRDTELLINLNTPRLRQLAGNEDGTARDRDAKLRLVNRVFGDDPADPRPAWLEAWHRIGDAVKWEEWAANEYVVRLQRENPRLHGLSFPVRETFRSNPKYYLVFLTRADEAVLAMNEFMCTEDEDLFARTEAITRHGQATLFPEFREDEQGRKLTAILKEMHAHGRAHQGVCRDELIKALVFAHFGEFKQKNYRDAFARLLKSGRARRHRIRGIGQDPVTYT